jgi:hypothetical protein
VRYTVESVSYGMVFIPSFYDGWFSHSSNIKVITSAISEDIVLLLLIGGIHEMVSGAMIYVPSSMTIGSGIQVILRLLPQQFERLQCWCY